MTIILEDKTVAICAAKLCAWEVANKARSCTTRRWIDRFRIDNLKMQTPVVYLNRDCWKVFCSYHSIGQKEVVNVAHCTIGVAL